MSSNSQIKKMSQRRKAQLPGRDTAFHSFHMSANELRGDLLKAQPAIICFIKQITNSLSVSSSSIAIRDRAIEKLFLGKTSVITSFHNQRRQVLAYLSNSPICSNEFLCVLILQFPTPPPFFV